MQLFKKLTVIDFIGLRKLALVVSVVFLLVLFGLFVFLLFFLFFTYGKIVFWKGVRKSLECFKMP